MYTTLSAPAAVREDAAVPPSTLFSSVTVEVRLVSVVAVAALPVMLDEIEAGNLASAIVPDAILVAFNAVR